MFEYTFTLSDIKTFRTRIVYNLITLVSEVSGFSDILFVGISIFLEFFYVPRSLETFLIKNMGPVELRKPIKKRIKLDTSLSFKLDKIDIYDLIFSVHSQVSLKLNIWFILIQSWIPERWRS